MADPLRVVLRDLAQRDIETAVGWYRDTAGLNTALAFVESLAAALDHVARHPGSGSPRYATELDLPGLRSWRLNGFPHLAFYVVRDDHIDAWRLLHAQRDLPAWLGPPDHEA